MKCEQGIGACYRCQSTFIFLLLLLCQLAPTGRLLLLAGASAWLDAARWTWRADGLRLRVGLSAGFISSYGFPANPFNHVYLLVSVMKRVTRTARYRQAGPMQRAPSDRFVGLHLISSRDGYAVAGKTFACSHLLLVE